jgi:MoxR-like ATPase
VLLAKYCCIRSVSKTEIQYLIKQGVIIVLDEFRSLEQSLTSQIVGQRLLVERLLIALLADGHLLVEGAPGLAKTKAIKTLSEEIEGNFQRIQFTPDLLPSDITGTEIYRPESASFEFQNGPIFHNLVLADEINRAPAKVQSALLEAMSERQVSVGSKTMDLPRLFLVMATQNPIEQEGTYPLPEAQLDRFLMHVKVGYPDSDAERAILEIARNEARAGSAIVSPVELREDVIMSAREEVMDLHMAEPVEEYLLQLILATRNPGAYGKELAGWLDYGASPRATIALDRCARARAWLHGRDYVSPDDVQAMIHDCLRHRLILSFEAEADGKNTDMVIDALLEQVPVA